MQHEARLPNDWSPGTVARRLPAAFLGLVALYGVFSLPGLWARWGGPSLAGIVVLSLWLAAAALTRPLVSRSPGRKALIAIGAVLVLVRCAATLPFLGRTAGGDALLYPLLAWSLLHGHGLQVFEPFMGGTMRALFPPLFPMLLAGWGGLFGLSTASLCILNLLIDAATAWSIARLGARLGAAGAGRGAAWLYMIWPPVLLSAPVAQKEGLVALLVMALVHAWLDAARDPRARNAAAIGVATALLALTQPALVPLSALLGLCLLGRDPRALARIAIAAMAVAAALMAPWWLRNWLVFHHFVPLTTAGGSSLWIGNNPEATGNWMPMPRDLRGLPEIAYSQAAAARAWAWIGQEPAGFLHLTAQKLMRAMAGGQAEVARLGNALPHPPPALGRAIFPLTQISHLLLLGGAAFALWRPTRAPIAALLAAFIFQILLFNVWFEFSERHREFLTPLLLIVILAATEARGRADRARP